MTIESKPVKAAQPTKAPRQSVTFTPEIYSELERLSKLKKVSIAWVVREATEKYIAEQYPLFARTG
jgi:predicted DNA-binding protein